MHWETRHTRGSFDCSGEGATYVEFVNEIANRPNGWYSGPNLAIPTRIITRIENLEAE